MFQIRKFMKSALLLAAVVLVCTGCNMRLATKEDWITVAPDQSAAVTDTADSTSTEAPAVTAEASRSPDAVQSTPAGVPTEKPTASSEGPAVTVPSHTGAPTSAPTAKATPKATVKPAVKNTPVPTPAAMPVSKQQFTVSIKGPEGMLVSATQLQYERNVTKTVFDVTMELCESRGLPVVYSGSVKRNNIYIKGIGDFHCDASGGSRGWVYYVNGTFPSIPVSSYVLKDGDLIEWQYTR